MKERGPMRILVVDDEENIREGCRQALGEKGYRIEVAKDGRQALESIARRKPDLILLDLRIPGIDGMEILKRIRDIGRDIVCIVITGYGTPGSAVEAMKLGAADYLCKPFDDACLIDAVRSGLGNRRPLPSPSRIERLAVPRGIKGIQIPPPAPQKRFLSPMTVAEEVAAVSGSKCKAQVVDLVILGILAGVYIGFGAQLCTMVIHDLARFLGVGMAKFIGGSVFSVGLMLVILAGAELFTGNCLILTGVLAGKCSAGGMLRNWSIVYLANFAGSILLAGLMFGTGLWETGNLGVGAAALKAASVKVDLTFLQAFFRGVGCNWLVCLAVWLAIAGRDVVSKILGIYFPIMTFVASGFEHSVANMYFIPMGLFLKQNPAVVNAAGLTGAIDRLTWSGFFVGNLIPVTLGNVVGGALFVGGAYYLTYLRNVDDEP